MKIKRLLLQFAMQEEAQPTINALGLTKTQAFDDPVLPFQYYQKKHPQIDILLVTQGVDPRFDTANVGTQAAVLCAHQSILAFKPDLVINAGTAGFLKLEQTNLEAEVGEVFLSQQSFIFNDRQIPLPHYDQYGLGLYPSVDTSDMARRLGLKTAIVTTGNCLIQKPSDLEVMQTQNAHIKDMEAAAISWVCWLHKMPFFAVKAITNILNYPTASETQFIDNFNLCVNNLSDKIKLIYEIIINEDMLIYPPDQI